MNRRAQFATRMGVVATTVGSAVGLGNIWRFPYEAGTHGGGAFLLCYLFFIFVIGVPVISAEFVMGRASRSGIIGSFRCHSGSRRWDWIGYSSILAAILILSFYSVVAGWTMEYTCESVIGRLGDVADDARHDRFDGFISGWGSVWWMLVFLLINALVLLGGVKKGIERMSNILMPLLFLILLVFCVNSLLMSGAAEGLAFLFSPDFNAITPGVVLGAMGQAFFSLSIGLGCMMTYASYFSDRTPIVKSATTTALLDTLVAVLSGVIIFPAVFSFGMEAEAGPKLVFEVLPSVFGRLSGSDVWSALFFFLLALASLTSTISMSEIFISFACDEFRMSRRTATVLLTLIAMSLGTLCALSFGPLRDFTLWGKTFFDLFDYVSSNILLPVGGMVISLFVGWRLDRDTLVSQLNGNGRLPHWVMTWIVVSLRYIAPLCILAVFLAS
jgi:NSS family neurotransmitter:Na+ symporter